MTHLINATARVRDVIVIGASAGGIQAVIALLSRFPEGLHAIVGVVIHRGNHTQADWSSMLGRKSSIRVIEPVDGAPLTYGVVHVAPPDCHMRFVDGHIALDRGAKQHFTRPAVDPLFTSASVEFGPRVVGVVLSGSGDDGLQGLLDIKAAGGLSLAQNPLQAEHASMPEHAIVYDHVDAVLSVEQIGDALVLLAKSGSVSVPGPKAR
ncbi:MAG: chemotaxis protein CheB [Byssovorax sp.]